MYGYNRNRNRNKKARRAEIYKVSKDCIYDKGYSPLKEEVNELWLGINCDNPAEIPLPQDNCKYKNYYPPYSTYQGMDREDLHDIKLECAYNKYKWKDPDIKTNKNKIRLKKSRKKTMLHTIKTICKQNKIFCSKIGSDGTDKSPDTRCLIKNSCGESLPGLSAFIDDIKDFYKIILELFDFSNLKMNIDTDKVIDENKERSKVISKKIKKLKEEYKNLNIELYKVCNKKKQGYLEKNVSLYEVEYSGKKNQCFSVKEIAIIDKYINLRDEQVKIDPSIMRRMKRMGRSAKQSVHTSLKNQKI